MVLGFTHVVNILQTLLVVEKGAGFMTHVLVFFVPTTFCYGINYRYYAIRIY